MNRSGPVRSVRQSRQANLAVRLSASMAVAACLFLSACVSTPPSGAGNDMDWFKPNQDRAVTHPGPHGF